VRDEIVICWFEDFRDWVTGALGKEFPLEPSEFLPTLTQYATTTSEGQISLQNFDFGILDGRLRYAVIRSKSIGSLNDPREKKEPIYEQWKDYL